MQAPARERTYIMIKPDGVQRGLIGTIITRFETKGFKLVAMKLCQPGKAKFEEHYADLSKKGFFARLVEYAASGPVCCMIWEGDNAVKTGRKMLGATKPFDSEPGTIRGDLCIDVGCNVIHGSDSVESANHEIGLWFTPEEICNWNNHSESWVYENELQVKLAKKVIAVEKPYTDQKPGTSGLRKKVKVFTQKHYLENFVQSIFNALPNAEYEGKAMVVSGDGRYYNDVATQIIIQIAISNGVRQVYIGQHCLLSTPAVSAMIRKLNEDNGAGYCFGGIVLSASHNPGGPDEDFGIKFNGQNGGPSLESVTEEIFNQTKKITQYTMLEGYTHIDTSTIGEYKLPKIEGVKDQEYVVSVVDNAENWVNLMKSLFSFDQIGNLIKRNDFNMCVDSMHGVAGPYANKIFGELFGLGKDQLMRCNVLPDFGGCHPDPNLTYAKELVEKMGVFVPKADAPDFGAACDGDADRNMILGKGFFVTPSDSVAIIVAQYKCIPYLAGGVTGAARSMPTSGALDMVTTKLNLGNYETPTGWKFFGNLLDSEKIHICGEESFGTGSSHVREKDGLWAVLCWLQILAAKNQDSSKPLVTIEQIVKDHWATYGRNYYRRYDYEGLETEDANKVFARIESQFDVFEKESAGNTSTNFSYTDPVDGSVSKNQGYIFKYADGSRFVFRKSGTGSSGATIRVYLEKYSKDINQDVAEALKDISDRALSLCQLTELTGRKEPTVIT